MNDKALRYYRIVAPGYMGKGICMACGSIYESANQRGGIIYHSDQFGSCACYEGWSMRRRATQEELLRRNISQ